MRIIDKVALAVTGLTLFAYGGLTILPTDKDNSNNNNNGSPSSLESTVETANGTLTENLEGKLTFGSNIVLSQDPTGRVMWAHKPFEAVKKYFMDVFPGENFYTFNLESSEGGKWNNMTIVLTSGKGTNAAQNGVSVFEFLKNGKKLYEPLRHPGKIEGYTPIDIKGEKYVLFWGSYQEPNDKGITGPTEAREQGRPFVGYFKIVPKSMQSPGGIQSYHLVFGQEGEGDAVRDVKVIPRPDGTLNVFAATLHTIPYSLHPYALHFDGASNPKLVVAPNSK